MASCSPLGKGDSRYHGNDILLSTEGYFVTKVTSLPIHLDTSLQEILLFGRGGRGGEGEERGGEGVLGLGKVTLTLYTVTHSEREVDMNKSLTNAPASMISSSTGVEQSIENFSCVFLDFPPFLTSFFCRERKTEGSNTTLASLLCNNFTTKNTHIVAYSGHVWASPH